MSLTLSTTSTSEISNVTDINPYQATRIVVHRPSTKMIESFSWTNSAIVVKEEDGCPNGQLSSYHDKIDNAYNEKGSNLVVRRASILFSCSDHYSRMKMSIKNTIQL